MNEPPHFDPQRLATLVSCDGPRESNEIRSPLDGSLIGKVPILTSEDVDKAVERARRAQKTWARMGLSSRCRVASRFRDLVLDEADGLMDLIHLENGKSRINAFEEVLDTALTSAYYSKTAPRHLADHRRRGAIPFLTSTFETHQPKGVVGIISPWNYPLTLAVSDAIPALLAGNAVVLKPDSATPFTALAACSLLIRAGLPNDVMQIVTGPGAVLGTPLIDAVDYMMFTGSGATGRTVAARCGERLIGSSMELGGKNPMLVLADADLERTVEGAVQACFSSTGQLCVSIERIYVHSRLYAEFCRRFAERVKQIRLGTADNWEVDLGPLINQAQMDKVSRHVEDAVSRGATVVAGGRKRPDLGPLFYEPTVLTGVTEDMMCWREETFGPVVSVYLVHSDAEAIEQANDTPYGLNASVWSRSLAHARGVARQLRTGTVNINEGYAASWGSHDAPMGGMGISGLGRRHGRDGIVKYTEPQTIAAQHLLLIGPPPGVTRRTYSRVMTMAGRLLWK